MHAASLFFAGEPAVVHQPFKHAAGQQAHVFSKKAEQALREEMRDFVGVGLPALRVSFFRRAALAQAFGQRGKAARGGFGDVAAGLLGPKAFGRRPDAAQQRQFGRLVEFDQLRAVGFGRVAGELGVDADRQAVADDQDGQVARRQAVTEQLLERGVKVFAGCLVFSSKGAAPEHVGVAGAPAKHKVFFFKQIARFAAGLGHVQQFAQVQEMALRALLFVQAMRRAAGTPFLNKVMGRHGVLALEAIREIGVVGARAGRATGKNPARTP